MTKGSAPSLSVAVNPATNRVVGWTYDANGNLLVSGAVYDVENRLVAAPWEEYAYDVNNRRVWKRQRVSEYDFRMEVYFYGPGGERLGTYELVRNGAALSFTTVADNLYFAGRLIRTGREVVAVDRLGSVRWRRHLDTGAEQRFDYWPWGQEKPQATAQGREKFATYYRDATGFDYAGQRYYASQWGRFLTADPLVSTTALRDPTAGCGSGELLGSERLVRGTCGPRTAGRNRRRTRLGNRFGRDHPRADSEALDRQIWKRCFK